MPPLLVVVPPVTVPLVLVLGVVLVPVPPGGPGGPASPGSPESPPPPPGVELLPVPVPIVMPEPRVLAGTPTSGVAIPLGELPPGIAWDGFGALCAVPLGVLGPGIP